MTTLAQLITQTTKAALYKQALTIASALGLPVTTWETGDPTRSLYHVLSTSLASLEQIAARYVASGFLDFAAALTDSTWLYKLAYQVYGYTPRVATYATCTVTLTNSGGGLYPIVAQDLTFAKASDPNITYRNTSGGTLAVGPGTTLDVAVECEIAGSDGSTAVDTLTLVTGLVGVTATSNTISVGADAESALSIVAGCRAKLESLSPNGAPGAYSYVALKSELTGAGDITRAAVFDDSTQGYVYVYLASSGGAASAPDVALAEAAIVTYATPLCITPFVASATAVPVDVTCTVYLYDTVGADSTAIKAAVVSAVQRAFAAMPIGGHGTSGKVYRAKLISAIIATYPAYMYQVDLTLPASDVTLTGLDVATTDIEAADVTVVLESP